MAATTAALTSSSTATFFPSPRPASFSFSRHAAAPHHQGHRARPLRVVDDSKQVETADISELDKLVGSMNFGELCNEFECISSPYVESTARQLVRDILELREGDRQLNCYAVSVIYKDPLRTFVGREKYKRELWATKSLENPTVTVEEMAMLSTSVLTIKWTLRGKPKIAFFAIGGDLLLRVVSKFTLNQISGQVLEHEEEWDVEESFTLAQTYFWVSRRIFSIVEFGKDVKDAIDSLNSESIKKQDNLEIYPDPSGDPAKFFQNDNGFQRDAYQVALFLAVVYFIVQFLKTTL